MAGKFAAVRCALVAGETRGAPSAESPRVSHRKILKAGADSTVFSPPDLMNARHTIPLAVAAAAVLLAPMAFAQQAFDFQREIRPVLSNICFKCHGPDEKERKGGKEGSGGLRLDTEEGSRADLDGTAAI